MKLSLGAVLLLCLPNAAALAADVYKPSAPMARSSSPTIRPPCLAATPAPVSYTAARMSRSQLELIAFYERNVVATRQVLVGALQKKRLAAARATLTFEAPADHP